MISGVYGLGLIMGWDRSLLCVVLLLLPPPPRMTCVLVRCAVLCTCEEVNKRGCSMVERCMRHRPLVDKSLSPCSSWSALHWCQKWDYGKRNVFQHDASKGGRLGGMARRDGGAISPPSGRWRCRRIGGGRSPGGQAAEVFWSDATGTLPGAVEDRSEILPLGYGRVRRSACPSLGGNGVAGSVGPGPSRPA